MQQKIRRHKALCWSSVLMVGLLAAACGNASSGGSDGSASGTTTVKVGVLPIADVAPLYLGIKKGFFAKQHLKVQPHALQGGAAVASATVGGSLQFGFGATANVLLAKAHKLPVQFVANGDRASSSAKDAWSGILVNKSSGITSVKQLAGKKVAVNARHGANELALDSILMRNGMSPSSVHPVVLPFPTMPSALASGHVQAVTEVEPFVSAISAKGGKRITPLFEAERPSQMVAGYFTTSKQIQSDPSLVKRFVAAMNRSLDYAESHPSAVRTVIPTYTKISGSVAAKMALPVWGAKVDTASITEQANLMRKLGWLTTDVPTSSIVWSGAQT